MSKKAIHISLNMTKEEDRELYQLYQACKEYAEENGTSVKQCLLQALREYVGWKQFIKALQEQVDTEILNKSVK